MPNPPSMELRLKSSQNIKQLQRLIMSRQMQQAIHFLQAPVMELAPLVEMEMEANPVLEYSEEAADEADNDGELDRLEEESAEEDLDGENAPEKELTFDDADFEVLKRLDEDFRDHFSLSEGGIARQTEEEDKLQAFLESSLTRGETLFEHLMDQAREAWADEKKQAIAETVIGSLDDAGFLGASSKELAALMGCSIETIDEVVATIQTFDPVGVGAKNLKETLLIQLKSQKKEKTLAYAIIDKHFDDLLHNRIPTIKKKLHCTEEEIGEAVDHDIAKLDLHPGLQVGANAAAHIIPDVALQADGELLTVSVNDDSMPKVRLSSRYLRMLNDESLPKETKEFIKQKIQSAKWLLRNIMQRNSTIERIAESLAKRQKEYFLKPDGELTPLTMKTLADELEVHESTIARAVSNKYIDTPRGVLPLRSFFTTGLAKKEGDDISSSAVRDMLEELIRKEDKRKPLSDEVLSEKLSEKGIKCARRTIAKYRAALKIGTAQQRRKFSGK